MDPVHLLANTYSAYSPSIATTNYLPLYLLPILFIILVLTMASNWIIYQKVGQPGWASSV